MYLAEAHLVSLTLSRFYGYTWVSDATRDNARAKVDWAQFSLASNSPLPFCEQHAKFIYLSTEGEVTVHREEKTIDLTREIIVIFGFR